MITRLCCAVLLGLALLQGCSSAEKKSAGDEYQATRYSQDQDAAPLKHIGPDDVSDAVPRADPILAAGNKSPYTVNGATYEILKDYRNYKERGTASWYGSKFHGHETSNGEIFDLYAASAAHKTLPLPTYARVTNLDNGRSVVVRVNDRGPFHGGRLIDLSYAAAVKLGYMEKGVSDKPAYVSERRIVQRKGYDLKRVCRGMLAVDEMVGQIVKRLERQGRLDNTMLVLTSDNGMAYGSQRFLHDKKAPYGTQVPLMVRWPRVLGTVPKTVDERVQNIDFAPTVCDIAGCDMGPFPNGSQRADGVSWLKLLTRERKDLWRKAVVTSYQDEARVPRYWSVSTTGTSPLAGTGCKGRKRDACRWMYTEYETGEVELYDLSNGPCHQWKRSRPGDPCLLKNKAGQSRYASIQGDLRRILRRLTPLD